MQCKFSTLFPKLRTLSWVSVTALCLSGCPTVSLDPQVPVNEQQLQTLRQIAVQQDRLHKVSAPLLIKNTALCGDKTRKLIGFTAQTRHSYSEDYVRVATALGFDERLHITGVLGNSGAARAGVRRGDILLSIENQPAPQGPNAEHEAAALLAPLVGSQSALNLGLLREGKEINLNVPLTSACGFGIELGNVDSINAYADGRRILITRGMLNLANNNTELAYVVARELAHNVLNHATQQHMRATIGAVIDNMKRVKPDLRMLGGSAGILPFSKELDVEADTLALYMLARAGYSIEGAPLFWQRLAQQYPASIKNGYTALHPATSARLAAIRKTIANIKVKQASRRPLVP